MKVIRYQPATKKLRFSFVVVADTHVNKTEQGGSSPFLTNHTANARARYVFDTFRDVDRGYYPRHAFIDRRFNPRPAARAFATLNALLSAVSEMRVETGTDLSKELVFVADGQSYSLFYGGVTDIIACLQVMGNGDAIDRVTNKEQNIATVISALQIADPELLQVILIRK